MIRRGRSAALVIGVELCLLVLFVSLAPASAGSTPSWTPIDAPAPTTLPNGNTPSSAALTSTACPSATFCVAVGSVADGEGNMFPLIETYSDGSWDPSIAPMPSNASENFWSGDLTSVSCPTDTSCVAVGDYYSFDPGTNESYESGLLDILAAGGWSSTEATLPDGPESGSLLVNAVACPQVSLCRAIGVVTSATSPQTSSPLLYTLAGGNWQTQVIPLPSNFDRSVNLGSISCPDTDDCTVVGSYAMSKVKQRGLIATMSSGQWSAVEAPVPANAATGRFSTSEPLLASVDCPQVAFCVAGGSYPVSRSSGITSQALLLVYQSGSWVPLEAPLPGDADTDLASLVNGVFCPAVNACLAAGRYNVTSGTGSEEGMLLTQASSSWSAISAPTPGDNTTSTSVAGLSCSQDGHCAAVGSDSTSGLIETESVGPYPTVASVSPPAGPVGGGTGVTITGTDFAPGITADFGAVAASTTYVNAETLTATSPAASEVGSVDVTVSGGGLASRTAPGAVFSYQPPATALSTATALASSQNPVYTGQSTIFTAQVSPAPDGGTVNFLSNGSPIAACQDLALVSAEAQCPQTYHSTPGDQNSPGSLDISVQYSGDLDYGASSASLTQDIDVGTLQVTTTQLPKGSKNRRYAVTIDAFGGNGPYSWTVYPGSQLPPGLDLSEAGGVLAGRPASAGTFSFIVEVTDSTSPTALTTTEALSLTVR
jgi:hypothetical protein